MTFIATRSSALAIKEETTEGTPVAPSSTGDYVALQDDFSMSPSFDTIENAELRDSIGAAKPINGLENPEASFSHYLRHSGIEGEAPNYALLLKSALGTETVNSTEDDTVNGSSTTNLVVNTGEGADYPRGRALLIKDSTNGYRIRAVHTDAVSDSIPLSFMLPNAPASGINLGKSVDYAPVNTGHKSLSLWHFVGNSGAIQMMAGAKVSEMAISIAAGDLINASYSFSGAGYYFDPIEIKSTDRYLDFTNDDGTAAAVIAAKMYKDPHDLASALQTAMRNASPGETATVTYSDVTGKYTIKSTGTVLSLLWNSGTNAANTVGDKIGFLTAADDTGTAATTGYTSDNALVLSSPQTGVLDDSDPLAAKDNEVMIGDQDDYQCFGASSVDVTISNELADVLSVCAESGKAANLVTTRAVTISVTSLLQQYDADKWARFRQGIATRFQYSFGTKSGGNWVPGKCGMIYAPDTTITSFTIADQDGQASLEMELTAYVAVAGEGEIFIGFV